MTEFSQEEMELFFGNIPHEDTQTATPTDDSEYEPVPDLADEPMFDDDEVEPEPTFSVAGVLVDVFAGLHGLAPSKVSSFADSIRNEAAVMAAMDEHSATAVDGFCQLVERSASHTNEARFDMRYLPSKRAFSDRVAGLHNAVCSRIGAVDDPYLTWNALLDTLRMDASKRAAVKLMRALDSKDNPDVLIEAHEGVASARPVRSASTAKARPNYRASNVYEEWLSNQTGTSTMRLSCGLPSLDGALTPPGRPVGFLAPGEQAVVAGDTGTGKTSFCYAIASALTNDLRAWGLPDALVVLAHTEEQERSKIEGMRMAPGQRFSYLGKNMVVKNIGTERRAIAEMLYDLVMDANERAHESGRPITDFLPYVFILDYIQALSEAAETEQVSITRAAELILRGIQNWSPNEIAKFSGLTFEEHAGYPWPAGQERHLVACVTFAQLRKVESRGGGTYQVGGKNPMTDYTLEYQDGDPVAQPWTGPDGGVYCWEVNPGDARMLGVEEVYGSGLIVKNADHLLFLHRSRPRNNPAVGNHLQDTRARIQVAKARHGSAVKFVPLQFDLQPDGPKAQYFDPVGFVAVQQGIIEPNDIFAQYGDPICPQRGEKDPFADVNYHTPLMSA